MLHVDRVDLVPTEPGMVLIRVSGRWEGERPRDEPALHVAGRRITALTETSGAAARAAAGPDAFRATFSVPEELRGALRAGLRLEAGGREFDLPAVRDAAGAVVTPPDTRVVDRAVLAERRAQRAELAEEAMAGRVEEAEREAAELEGELAKLELRLEGAIDERSELSARLADVQRDARLATQRAEAERRRREEALYEVAEVSDEAEAEIARLRERARVAGERMRDLDRQVEALRRRVSEAEHAADTAESARARTEAVAREAEARAARMIERERATLALRRVAVLGAERALAARALSAPAPGSPAEPSVDVSQLRGLFESERRSARARNEPGDTGALREEARHAAAAVAEAAWALVEARDAVGGAGGALEAERARTERLGEDLRTERAETARLRSRAEDTDAALREYSATAGEALDEAERRIGEARDAAVLVQERLEAERLERERAERELRADLAREVEEATARVRGELAARISELAADLAAEREARRRAEAAAAGRPPAAEPAPAPAPKEALAREEGAGPAPAARPKPRSTRPWLPSALRRLAAEDPASALRLGLQLLPAQALAVERAVVDYDLLAGDLGWQAVALRPGRGTVANLHQPRPRRRADFRLTVDAPALVELLARGGGREVRRAGRARVRGTLRRRRALKSLPPAPLDLAELARAGVWPDPGLVLGALALLIDPGWTEGDALAVALEVVGPRGGRWTLWSPGGAAPTVAPGRPERPSATVRMTQGALQALLAGRAGAAGKAAVRGDVVAVGRLVGWIERAQLAAR